MDLSIREAATLIGRSARTLRAQVARGEIAGVKHDGHWRIARHALPMTESQRSALQARAELVRDAVERALPSRTAYRANERRRSIIDVDCFRAGKEVWRQLESLTRDATAGTELCAAREALRRGLLELCQGVNAFDPPNKLVALRAARGNFSQSIGHLLLSCDGLPDEPVRSLLARLEVEVLPALGGLLRWVERLPERKR